MIKRVVKIGSHLIDETEEQLITFMQDFSYVVTKSLEDMPKIDTKVVCYRLNVGQHHKLVKKNRRTFNQERYEAIEVDCLLQAGIFKEAPIQTRFQTFS